VKEAYRDERGVPWIESILQDVRTAVRSLRRAPGFVALALVTLSLGISLNTTAFSFLDALLLEPLPFRDWIASPRSTARPPASSSARTRPAISSS